MLLAFAGVRAPPMRMTMAFVTTLILALVRWTLAVCATAQALFITAVAVTSLKVTAIATATSWMPSAFAAVLALQMLTTMAFVTMWILALARWTPVAFATGPALFMTAAAVTSLRVNAIATGTSWMRWVFVVEAARRMLMTMAFVTM
jgi:hypothetical protein